MQQSAVRSGVSYWRGVGPAPINCPQVDGEIRCDVAVVGGGITGALVSQALSRAGMDVVIVDRQEMGAGSTAASTGLLQYEVDLPLVDLIARVGEAHAVHAYRRGQQAIDELESVIQELGASCDFARRSTLYLASHPQDLLELRRECECRQHHGFDVTLLEEAALRELSGIDAPGALSSTRDAEVDPYRLTQATLKKAIEQGARAFSRTAVTGLNEDDSLVTLTTPHGAIRARYVVLATGYFPNAYIPADGTSRHTTYAVTSAPLQAPPRWPGRCLIWETARPYFYARQVGDGRMIIGGEDSEAADDHQDDALLARKAGRLIERLQTLFPGGQFTPEFIWAGTFAETKDGLPFIGKAVGHERVFSALGYGGNGITFSVIAARLLVDLILHRPNPDAEVFRCGR